jgi:hypothetical protein
MRVLSCTVDRVDAHNKRVYRPNRAEARVQQDRGDPVTATTAKSGSTCMRAADAAQTRPRQKHRLGIQIPENRVVRCAHNLPSCHEDESLNERCRPT